MKKILYVLLLLVSVSTTVMAKSSKGVIKVGTNATHPPFVHIDEKTRKITGHDIELITKILTNLGYKVEVEDMKFDGLIPAVMTNKIDVISCGLTVNPERAERVLFTDTYYHGGSHIVVLKGNKTIKGLDDLKDKTVGVEIGTVQAKFAHDNADKIGKIVEYNSEEFFLALSAKKVDAIIDDTVRASYMSNTLKVMDSKFVGEPIKARSMAYAVNKKNTKLADEINAELAKLKKDGWYKANYKKWFGDI